MSHKDDQYDNDNFERWLKGDDAVSRTYQGGDQPGPSALLDAQILAQAATATQSRPNIKEQAAKRPAWMLPVAAAATLMVGVNLAVLVRDNTPDPSVEAPVFAESTAMKKSAPIVSDIETNELADARVNATVQREPRMANNASAAKRAMDSANLPGSNATVPALTDSIQAGSELGNDHSTNSNLTGSTASHLGATHSADENSLPATQIQSNTAKKDMLREQEARAAVELLRQYQEENQRRAAASGQFSPNQVPAETEVDLLLEQVRQGRSSEASNADRLARFAASSSQRDQDSAADKPTDAGQEDQPTAVPRIRLSENFTPPKVHPVPQSRDPGHMAQQESEAKLDEERANKLRALEDARQELQRQVAQARPSRIVEQLHESSGGSLEASTPQATPAAEVSPSPAVLADSKEEAHEEIVVTARRTSEREESTNLEVLADVMPATPPMKTFICVLDDFQITPEQIKRAYYDALNQTPPRTTLSWRAHIRDLAAIDDYRAACVELAAHKEFYPNTVFLDDFPVRFATTEDK